MANAQWKYKTRFELPKNLHKAQYRNQHYGSERSWDLDMCHLKPRTGHILDWKTNKPQNMDRNNYIFVCEIFVFWYAENWGVQNMPKLYE